MRTNQNGIDLIKQFEGLSLKVYTCPAGYPTIGYGHRVWADEKFDEPITKQEAILLLKRDLIPFERGVEKLFKVHLTENQFAALVSFAYNLGLGSLQRSTLRMRINNGYLDDIAKEFAKWSRANGKVLPGLLRRRLAEAALFVSDAPSILSEDDLFG